MEQGEIILYQPDEAVKLEVRLEDETVWLTQEQIADLFGTKRPAITKHLNNIYKSGELDIDSTCSILEHMGNDGKQRYTTKYYNLDAILSIGYRVNSKNATLFRKWANSVLKDYLLKGYSINKRLSELERTVAQHTEKIDHDPLQLSQQPVYQQPMQPAYNPADHTAEFAADDISKNKVTAMAAYMLGIIGIVIALLAAPESPYASFHSRQALKLEIVNQLILLAMIVLIWTFIVPIVGAIAMLAIMVIRVILFFQVCAGKAKDAPLIGSLPFLK